MSQQLAFALDIDAPAATPAPTPATGRAARRPDRSSQQVQQQPEEPTIAVDFTRELSPEDMADVRAYADSVVPQLLDRAAAKYEGEELTRHLQKYAAGMALVAARVLASVERKANRAPAATHPQVETAAPKRGPGRPKKAPSAPSAAHPAAERMRMPPAPRLTRPAEESPAPVPAATRKPQPTAEEVIDRYRGLKAPNRAGGQP